MRIEANDFSDYVTDLRQQLATNFFNIGFADAADLFDKCQRQGKGRFSAANE